MPFGVLAVALVIGWLNEEERSGAPASGVDRLLRQQPAWPSRPG
jgi:hypothetical protein